MWSLQIGGNVVQNHPENWKAPHLLKSTLNKSAVTYRKEFDQDNGKNLQDRLRSVIKSFRPIIVSNHLESKTKAIKYYYSLKMIYHQAKDDSMKSN